MTAVSGERGIEEARNTVIAQGTPYRLNPAPHSSHTILLSHFPEPGSGARVLDVGCGDGYLGSILSERGYSVTGVERTGGFTERFPASVSLIEADLEGGLGPVTGTYDAVICADVLEHLRGPEELLREIARIMAPGGRLVLSLPNSGNFYFRMNVLLGRFPHEDRGLFDRTHLRFYTLDGWKELVESCGYTIRLIQPTIIPLRFAIPKWAESAIVRAGEEIYHLGARAWPSLFAYQFVVIAEPCQQ